MVKNTKVQAAFQRRVGAEAKKLMDATLKATLKANLQEVGAQVDTDSDSEQGWRAITGRKVDRDLSPIRQDKMLSLVSWFYDADLLAKRIIDLKKDFLVGEGVRVEAEGETDKIIKNFWHDPLNNMDLFVPDMARDIGLFGEQAYPAFVNDKNGGVRLGYLDPFAIDKVLTNPGNCRETIGLKVKSNYGLRTTATDDEFIAKWRADQGLSEVDEKSYLSVIGLDRKPNSETFGKLVGDTFYFAINKVTNATRGRSDLLSLMDWLHNYERFLFARVERARLLNSFIWDIMLKGFTEPQIKEWLKKHGKPRPGSMRAHNEKVEWEAVSPKLESSDASNEARMFRSHIAGGAGIPVYWLGGGEGLTRATALEMSTPVFKHLKTRQLYLKYMIHTILNFVIDQAIIHKRLRGKFNRRFNVKFPALSQKDLVSLSTTLSGVANALVIATDAGLVEKDEAKKYLKGILDILSGDVMVPASGKGMEPDEGVTEEDFVSDAALAKKLK